MRVTWTRAIVAGAVIGTIGCSSPPPPMCEACAGSSSTATFEPGKCLRAEAAGNPQWVEP